MPSVQYIQVTNLANTSSLVYHSLLSFPTFGDGPSSVIFGVGQLSPLFDFVHTRVPRRTQLLVDRGLPTRKKK